VALAVVLPEPLLVDVAVLAAVIEPVPLIVPVPEALTVAVRVPVDENVADVVPLLVPVGLEETAVRVEVAVAVIVAGLVTLPDREAGAVADAENEGSPVEEYVAVEDRVSAGVCEGEVFLLLDGVTLGVPLDDGEGGGMYIQLRVNSLFSVAATMSIDCTVTATSVVGTSTVQLASAKRPVSVQGSSLGASLKLRHTILEVKIGQTCAIASAGRHVPPRPGHT